jgi:DNA polymerase
VFGQGNPHAQIVFIGEAPGQKEDEQQTPFVGASGAFLDTLLVSIDLRREDVYITNVVKFRPPDNRDPTPTEKEQCRPWLERELDLIRPRIIVPLGRHALAHFLPDLTISEAHGRPFTIDARTTTIFPIYHPAAALHNGSLRQTLQHDFLALGDLLAHTPSLVA